MVSETKKIYINLLEEGTDVWRPTQGEPLGEDIFKVLPTPKYDPESEVWEFTPGSIVKCEMKEADNGEFVLVAVKSVKEAFNS